MTLAKTALASFDVDAQKSFTPLCPNELPVAGGDQIGAELNYMAGLAGHRVGSKDAHTPYAPWVVTHPSEMMKPTGLVHADLTWVSHCVPGTDGFTLLDELPTPYDYDYFVWKGVEPDLHPYGACYHDLHDKLSTGVIEYLKAQGVVRVLVGGLALDYCVKTTALQLLKAGLEVVLHLPACRGISEEGGVQAVNELLKAGAVISSTREELAAMATR
ncbi:nicotinamidase/pyrazinamidase [Pseudomonas sp. 31 E 6]|jgi:nicotinamidase/pyrazinamidase|uniref:nicotinamidase n=1 Tax=Pseudomonas fluorescens TaxID=294 RepID=A0A4Y9TAR9_PSEFL|nr:MULTISPECIES: nicotinamidase [Pseudomonas]TFW40450.1 nicotinamidase [Pseudomonas fluorescens]TKJ57036.1 nicotinamidase [Pseudomonas sp. CFBP13506]CRM18286.1 nicotinamidase/pyrazinamidase [Pseudomonas sp. 31 E 6]CRM34976.1 nicotinamidase/pyrazinamidase [Pseudomonas sp. 31 E 5]